MAAASPRARTYTMVSDFENRAGAASRKGKNGREYEPVPVSLTLLTFRGCAVLALGEFPENGRPCAPLIGFVFGWVCEMVLVSLPHIYTVNAYDEMM